MKTNKGFSIIMVVIIILVVLGGGYYFYQQYQEDQLLIDDLLDNRNEDNEDGTDITGGGNDEITQDESNGLETHENKEFDFRIKHPTDFQISEYSEGPFKFLIARLDASEIEQRTSKGLPYSYITITPHSCEQDSRTPVVTEIINDTAFLRNIHQEEGGYFETINFKGNPAKGWSGECNTIRMYFPGIENKFSKMNDVPILEDILQTFILE